MDIVVKGRNVEVPEHFRVHVAEKLARSERYDPKIIRVDVELSHETNRRQHKTCQRVQITVASRGPAVRAEASADNFYAALDAAVTKVETRLHRLHDRRRDRLHGRTPITAVAASPEEILGAEAFAPNGAVGTAVLEDEPAAARPARPRRSPTRTAGAPRTAARARSSGSRTTRPSRSPWTRPCCRWSSLATISTCSTIPRPGCPPWSTAGAASTTA